MSSCTLLLFFLTVCAQNTRYGLNEAYFGTNGNNENYENIYAQGFGYIDGESDVQTNIEDKRKLHKWAFDKYPGEFYNLLYGIKRKPIMSKIKAKIKVHENRKTRDDQHFEQNSEHHSREENSLVQSVGAMDGNNINIDDISDKDAVITPFESIFNITLGIDGRIVGYHKTLPSLEQNKWLNFTISSRWDGEKLEGKSWVTLSLLAGREQSVEVRVEGPFHGDPRPRGGAVAPSLHLSDYESVEMFFLNAREQYLEVQLGPYGHYQVILLHGRRNVIRWVGGVQDWAGIT